MSGPEPAARRLIRFRTMALRQLRPAFSRRFAALWLIVAVNLGLIVLYLWSRDGSTTLVRVEAIGSAYQASVDGHLIAEGGFQGRAEGGIGFRLAGDNPVHSLPGPTGIDSVRVMDAATGEVLFEDTFGGSPSPLWEAESGDWQVRDGVYTTPTRGIVTTGFQSWGDYILEAKLRNATEATVYLRAEDSRNAVAFNIRPFRHYNSWLALFEDGETVSRQGGLGVQLDRTETVRSMAAMLLRPYPIALLMVAGVIVLAFVLRLAWLERWLQAAGQSILQVANSLVLVLALGAFVLLWYLNYVVGEAIPHVPDSVLYIFQAKVFASFRVTADAPPVRESFSIFHPHYLHVVEGRWFSQYPFGHPLFLSFGQLLGAVWLVPPVLGAASVFLIYRLGTHAYGTTVGIVAAVLLAFSPFFQMTASNFMSHGTAVFVILACLFLLVRPTKHRMLSMFFSGVFLGLLLNIRLLTAAAFVPVLGAFMGYELLRAGSERGKLFREDLAFAAGGLLLLLAYFLYNQATTGGFTQAPYQITVDASNWLGFGGTHSLAFGLQNGQVLLSLMLLVANGWPVAIGLFLAALPFVLGSRNRWDYFLAGSAIAIAAATVFYRGSGIMHGPRYWYETMPFLMLLSARGVQCLGRAGAAAGDWLARRYRGGPREAAAGITGFAVFSLVAGLVVFSAYGWMLGKRDAWSGIAFVPQKMSMLEGFNYTDRRLLDRADELDLKNALVLVEGPVDNRCRDWWCYGSVFWTNSPDLNNDVVWAERQGTADDVALLEHFEDRDLYLADYGSASIRPVTSAQVVGSVETPVPEETPEAPGPEENGSAVERDQTRRQHLEQLRQALEDYAQREGGYPDTGGQRQTLCVYRELDAGCALATVLPELPDDPLGSSPSNGYWYVSDGSSFVLIARQEEMKVEQNRCPDEVTPHVPEGTYYCVQGPAP